MARPADPAARPRPPSGSDGAPRVGNGADGRQVRDLSLSPPSRRVRRSELAVGLLVTLLFAVATVLWHLRSVDRLPALALASTVAKGEVVTASDIDITHVPGDSDVAHIGESELETVVGQVALTDLPAGSLLNDGLLVPEPAVGDGEGVVGLLVEPGQYPSSGLAPGDAVNVIRISPADGPDPPVQGSGNEGVIDEEADAAASDALLVRGADVMSVEELESDRRLVALRTSESAAGRVAEVETGGLRLVEVPS